MKIEKAREIASLNVKDAGKTMPPDVKSMLIMSTSAFDHILAFRKELDVPNAFLLVGETFD